MMILDSGFLFWGHPVVSLDLLLTYSFVISWN